ncbi:MAG: hypothetical protein L0213_01990, partial [Candidatus Dadabacteria bacterium]|nr:hypothetical protein [Candidatus Dadabacteria bacterium]
MSINLKAGRAVVAVALLLFLCSLCWESASGQDAGNKETPAADTVKGPEDGAAQSGETPEPQVSQEQDKI